jgi:hypothetical protein
VALLLCGLGREPEEDSGGWGRGRREKISEGEGAAVAAWRRDRFRVSLLFSFFKPASLPFSIFLPPKVQNSPFLVCVEGNYL